MKEKQYLEALVVARDAENPRAMLTAINGYYREREMEPLTSLDSVTYEHSAASLGERLGFVAGSQGGYQRSLVRHGIFSTDLRQGYSTHQLEDIAHAVFIVYPDPRNGGKRRVSPYFSKELEQEVRESNQRLVVGTPTFKGILRARGIKTHDDWERDHASQTMGNVLGFTAGRTTELKERSVALGLFPIELKRYSGELRSRIVKRMIAEVEDGVYSKWESAYFLPQVPQRIREENKMIALSMPEVRAFLDEELSDPGRPYQASGKARNFFRLIGVIPRKRESRRRVKSE